MVATPSALFHFTFFPSSPPTGLGCEYRTLATYGFFLPFLLHSALLPETAVGNLNRSYNPRASVPRRGYFIGPEVSTGLNLATFEQIDVAQHSLQVHNGELCHDTSGSESVPKNEQPQLRAHARAPFASEAIGSINYPFVMLFRIDRAQAAEEDQSAPGLPKTAPGLPAPFPSST